MLKANFTRLGRAQETEFEVMRNMNTGSICYEKCTQVGKVHAPTALNKFGDTYLIN